MVTLRQAVLADASSLANVHKQCFGEAGWDAFQIAGSLALETTSGWIAEEEGFVFGFVLAQFVAEEAEILTFCVQSAKRRKGIGRLLLETLLAETPRDGFFLEVAEDNKAAIALYESAGFVVCGRRAGYYSRGDQSINALTYVYNSIR